VRPLHPFRRHRRRFNQCGDAAALHRLFDRPFSFAVCASILPSFLCLFRNKLLAPDRRDPTAPTAFPVKTVSVQACDFRPARRATDGGNHAAD
jgi:hypothetical protein